MPVRKDGYKKGSSVPDNPLESLNLNHEPLAARMRPRTLDEFVGQNHIIGIGRLLRRAIKADQLSSVIFYGPPGTGKTTLAQIIANTTKANFIAINAVLSGVKEIREAIEQAKTARQELNIKTILFIDEVHRFNKSQQDALLPHVENGTLTLIGATTENPYFEVNKALVSRSRIFQLKPLTDDDVRQALINALKNKERGYGNLKVDISDNALEHLVRVSNGDARSALNALELAVETTTEDKNGIIKVGLEEAEESIQRRAVLYDKDGDTHYDTISAFIKSIRGSDPDASLYWMAKMVYAGEDPRFIFRRMLILASEDIGLADPNALNIVISTARAYDYVGMPEGQFHLAQACLYLATAPKSNSTMSFFDALETVKSEKDSDVPDHLKDGNRDKNDLGHGKGYIYPHAYRDHWVAQQYLPNSLQGKMFYEPSEIGYEKSIKEKVIRNRELQMSFQDSWQDNYIFDKEQGLKNNWLNRALSQTGEILGKVREEVFELAKVRREDLVLDLTGESGFLTWEACRRCFAGGVWTRCNDQTVLKNMQEWIKFIQILNRPELFEIKLNELETYFYKLSEKPLFDQIIGFDILNKVGNKSKLIGLLSNLITQNGKVVLAEKSPENSQYLSDILNEKYLGNKLHKQLYVMEQKLRKENEDIKYFSKLFSKTKVISQDIFIKRHFSYTQLQKWFELNNDKNSNSIFYIIKNELSEKDYNKVKSSTFELLADKDINWKQSFNFFYTVK